MDVCLNTCITQSEYMCASVKKFDWTCLFLLFFLDDTVFPVLGLADEYQVDILLTKCEDYLLSKCKSTDTSLSALVNILLCAENYNIKELYNASFDRVSKCHPDDVKSVQEFQKLSDDTRGKFVRLREQALDVKLTGRFCRDTNFLYKIINVDSQQNIKLQYRSTFFLNIP